MAMQGPTHRQFMKGQQTSNLSEPRGEATLPSSEASPKGGSCDGEPKHTTTIESTKSGCWPHDKNMKARHTKVTTTPSQPTITNPTQPN